MILGWIEAVVNYLHEKSDLEYKQLLVMASVVTSIMLIKTYDWKQTSK